jgi:alcohol dehydrogenase class IV
VFGAGTLTELGAITKREGGGRVLLVTDAGIVAAGHVDRRSHRYETPGWK